MSTVKNITILVNIKANKWYCFLKVPEREAIEMHENSSTKYNWITQVEI